MCFTNFPLCRDFLINSAVIMSYFFALCKPLFRRSRSSAVLAGGPLLLTLLLAGGWPFPVSADAADGRDVYSLLRAERHEDVARYFSRRKPRSPIEYYALGQALIQQEALRRGQFSKNQAAAFRAFWQAAGIACDAKSGAGFAACLKGVPRESKASLIQRLALWRASKYAEKLGLLSLKAALLLRADLSVADPLSENLLSDRLQFYLQNGRVSEAVELAGRKTYGALTGPQASLWRARSFFKAGQKARALDYYIQAMRGTRVVWLERAIAQDVRRNYPGHFRASFPKKKVARNLTAFAGYASKGEIAALRKSLSAAFITRTTTADRVRGDGLFLIESGQAGALPGLSRAAYTYLSHTPTVLLDWTVRLRRKKQDGAALRLLADFKHVLPQNSTLWRNRIELLEKRGNRKVYFNEILAYQKRYHAHFSMADRMIEVLIGDNASKIRWAPESYWNAARQQLNPQTGNGRFVYWLKRYYLEKKNASGQRDLKRDFYSMAPGSFYAGAFWEDFIRPGAKNDRADFARDWNRIGGRQDYLRWVARHGGNDAAVQYLKHRDLTRYMDPKALRLWKDFSSGRFRSPEDLQQLYRLGERALGASFFDHRYDGRASRREQLAREAYLGYEAGWLHMSVYFTRQFMRDAGVPEDPFSMPAGLLKALYPRPYYGQVKRYADQYKIDSAMVYTLMRQESMFREQAVSRSGARGLMQIMPRTGTWLAGKMKIRNPNLMDPDTNINMGAKFFADLVRTQGDFRWASIAYNGGPGNLRKWKKRYYKDDFYFFLENLPIEEPRNYCRVTFQNYMHYKTTYTLYPQ